MPRGTGLRDGVTLQLRVRGDESGTPPSRPVPGPDIDAGRDPGRR